MRFKWFQSMPEYIREALRAAERQSKLLINRFVLVEGFGLAGLSAGVFAAPQASCKILTFCNQVT